tara:strand:- start:2702 stop:2944 length:243 start_codon:yes stop_codon:yes gene_type:complete
MVMKNDHPTPEHCPKTPPHSRDAVVNYATAVFESQQAAMQWLESPVVALGRKQPHELLDTPAGCETVYQLLRKIQTGDFS